MNTKAVVIGAVVIIALAAAGGVALYVINDNDKTPSTDYTLLDKTANIRSGMTIVEEEDTVFSELEKKTMVESVVDKKVTYHQTVHAKDKTYSTTDFYSYTPLSFKFDYTSDDIPEGFTVTKSGYTYTINGKGEVTRNNYTYMLTCTSLMISYTGSSVTEVFGSMTEESSPTAKSTLISSYDLKTEEGKAYVKMTVDRDITNVITASDFYSEAGRPFSVSDFVGATITSEAGTYAGLNVEKYTVNGKSNGHTYNDFDLYVYDGQIIHGEGKIDKADAVSDLSIYVK